MRGATDIVEEDTVGLTVRRRVVHKGEIDYRYHFSRHAKYIIINTRTG